MEWYIDGIPVAELKRRYEAHNALVKKIKEIAQLADEPWLIARTSEALAMASEHTHEINLTLIAANEKQLAFVVYNGDDWRAETYNGREVKRIEFEVYLHQGMMATAAQFSEKHAEAVECLKNLLAAEVRNG